MTAKTCQQCGASFTTPFVLTLDEALRAGAIVRGTDIEEEDVQESEAMAKSVRKLVMSSGDENLVKVIKQLPEESWARLKKLMTDQA
jgi:hypothetical protein